MLIFILLIIVLFNFYLLFKVKKQAKQIRILSAFIAGLSRYTTKSVAIEDVSKAEQLIGNLEYANLLDSIEKEFTEDFWIKPYTNFILNDKNLFYEEKMRNGGFNMMYWDFFDRQVEEMKKGGEEEDSGSVHEEKGLELLKKLTNERKNR